MNDAWAWAWEPLFGHHAQPRQRGPIFLAAPPERALPQHENMLAERGWKRRSEFEPLAASGNWTPEVEHCEMS